MGSVCRGDSPVKAPRATYPIGAAFLKETENFISGGRQRRHEAITADQAGKMSRLAAKHAFLRSDSWNCPQAAG